ncbi:hypothetical protein SAY86_008191 [Trapa natans]|uniref:HHO5-like N-terminal domain-containing protein n=1 Tax=Trapa natans TaxID=22666 RepID=A0AAN7QAH9_TRANT|nr:hypothetical protein SAY86_008191 [Trapa natans]
MMNMDHREKMESYVEALEEERRKVLVFQRELPLSLELVTQAIAACKQQLAATGVADCNNNGDNGQSLSDCSEQTSTAGDPVLEEFIPMNRPSGSADDEDDEQHSHEQMKIGNDSDGGNEEKSSSADSNRKSDWLRSAQLWNQTPDRPTTGTPRKVPVVEVKSNGGAFQPFHKEQQKRSANSQQLSEKLQPAPNPTTASSCTTKTAADSRREEKMDDKEDLTEAKRKQRRCWSPELHRRFLQALQQLGGSHGNDSFWFLSSSDLKSGSIMSPLTCIERSIMFFVLVNAITAATPKQIRELMKVDGLTNDEVKSHLQKYRLHSRRPSPTIHKSSNSQTPQIVVVGGIWVPPHEFTAVAAEASMAAAANGIYAPVAAAAPPPPPPAATYPEADSTKSPHLEGIGSYSNSSPLSVSSSHTTTSSPMLH